MAEQGTQAFCFRPSVRPSVLPSPSILLVSLFAVFQTQPTPNEKKHPMFPDFLPSVPPPGVQNRRGHALHLFFFLPRNKLPVGASEVGEILPELPAGLFSLFHHSWFFFQPFVLHILSIAMYQPSALGVSRSLARSTKLLSPAYLSRVCARVPLTITYTYDGRV
ncbi:hypothetical protein M407DRAFT_203513 [Tulasnella calospora MUT 4182]|uniref:Uncharacterized protein n=1 Tax=Tulasnella calospora MUT 4182 TaxID=1051891 RepID=A0A0C3LXE8_9AGAM|nr:hypothetical protein M407DRAFT_203513 [Tulasnella calospora MUT 4182]